MFFIRLKMSWKMNWFQIKFYTFQWFYVSEKKVAWLFISSRWGNENVDAKVYFHFIIFPLRLCHLLHHCKLFHLSYVDSHNVWLSRKNNTITILIIELANRWDHRPGKGKSFNWVRHFIALQCRQVSCHIHFSTTNYD